MLGGNPSTPAATNLLYSGEQFDTNLQQYYLRARCYDQNNGRFNRVDPYSGNMQDPQSLHKYLYCHANPVNGIDPSGMFTIVELLCVIGIIALSAAFILPLVHDIWFKDAEAISDNITMIICIGSKHRSKWKKDAIATNLKEIISPLEDKANIDIQLLYQDNPPGELGWSRISKDHVQYTGQVKFIDDYVKVIAVNGLGYTYDYKTTLSNPTYVELKKLSAEAATGKTLILKYPIYWANTLAHEQIWLGAAGLSDSDTFHGDDSGDIGSKTVVAGRHLAEISSGSKRNLIRGIQSSINSID